MFNGGKNYWDESFEAVFVLSIHSESFLSRSCSERCRNIVEDRERGGYLGHQAQIYEWWDGKYVQSMYLFVSFHGDLESKWAIRGQKNHQVDKYTWRNIIALFFFNVAQFKIIDFKWFIQKVNNLNKGAPPISQYVYS